MDLSLLPLTSSLILTVVSRLLYPYSTDDKTSRVMVKRFSTVRNNQRSSQSYMERRRGRREIVVTRRRRVGVKRGETSLASHISSLSVLQSQEHPERFTELSREEKGVGEIEVTWGEKEELQGGRAIKPVITTLSENGY